MKLSKGTLYTLLFLAAITLLGLIFTFTDYQRHGDLSTAWWPAISGVLFLIVLFAGKRTDGRATAVALLLLGGAAASCQRPTVTGDTAAEVRSCERQPVTMELATTTYTQNGWDCTKAEQGW